MAGRRVCTSAAVAVAMAVALLALLFAAGEAGDRECNVDKRTVRDQCMSACSGATPSEGCCKALQGADFHCLREHWNKHKDSPFATCGKAIVSKCSIPNAPKSC